MSTKAGDHIKSLVQRISVNKDAHKKDWTEVTFPATTLQEAMESITDIDPVLYTGIAVWKITSRGVWKRRTLTLSKTRLALFCTHQKIKGSKVAVVASALPFPMWTPSRGFSFSNSSASVQNRYVRYIDVADLDGAQHGVIATQTLELARRGPLGAQLSDRAKEIVSICHHGYRSLDVIIENDSHRKALIHALNAIRQMYHGVQHWIGNDALLLRYIWYDIDVDKSGMISSKQFKNMCQRINLELDTDGSIEFSEFLKSSKITGRNELSYGECMMMLQTIKAKMMPSENLWDSLFGKDTKTLSAETLLKKFLKGTQGEDDSTIEDAKSLLTSLKIVNLDGKTDDDELLHRAHFEEFLHSPLNDAYDPKTKELVGKLSQPISHFWINTSHNTYLMGDQLASRSSVEAYAKSLNRGCKCVELDCWDGDDEEPYIPVVFHGFTLTSKIGFRSICLVVNNYLESNPDSYPIILSLENHCSLPFQRTMASNMKEVFGSKLFIPNEEHTSDGTSLPSPEELRGMVVIKGKRPPESDEGKEGKGNDEKEEEEDPYDEVIQSEKDIHKKATKPPTIVLELAKMTLFHGNKFKDFHSSVEQAPSHMHSIGETKITKLVKENPALWRQYNINHMTRTYPAGSRVDSSNYNPILAWSMGCQLVALNFQTQDTPLLLNDGRFRQADDCGYVLKPASTMGGQPSTPKNISVTVVSGRCLPKPGGEKNGERIDPYVVVELHDVRLSENSDKEEFYSVSHSTSAVNNNGFCPSWNDNGKNFEVENPDVAMFLFKVMDDDLVSDDKIAYSAIPVSCLRKGYRSIQLYDHISNTRTGPFQYATLLVKIEIEESSEA